MPSEAGQLVVSRKTGQTLVITTRDGSVITIKRLGVSRLRICAPLSVKIMRGEVLEREGGQ